MRIHAVIVLIAFLLPAPSSALSNAFAAGTGECTTFGDFANREEGAFSSVVNANTMMCDKSTQSGNRFAQAVTNINVLFVKEPIVDVQASASQDNGGNNTIAVASGFLRYETDIQLKGPPPMAISSVPVIARSPYAMNTFGLPNGSATVFMTVDQPASGVFVQERRTFGVDAAFGEIVVKGPVLVGVPIEIRIEATCGVTAPSVGISGCQAIIDPILAFDQTAFDAIHGPNSFVLADFFEFGLSSNLPEPGVGVLLGFFAIGLSMRRPGTARSEGRPAPGVQSDRPI